MNNTEKKLRELVSVSLEGVDVSSIERRSLINLVITLARILVVCGYDITFKEIVNVVDYVDGTMLRSV